MTDTPTPPPPTSDEAKAALKPARDILDRLPADEASWPAKNARDAYQRFHDQLLRSIETTPPACANHATTCTPVVTSSLPDPLRPRWHG